MSRLPYGALPELVAVIEEQWQQHQRQWQQHQNLQALHRRGEQEMVPLEPVTYRTQQNKKQASAVS